MAWRAVASRAAPWSCLRMETMNHWRHLGAATSGSLIVMSAGFLVRPRSAASWVAWRAVASLTAPGCAFAWRQSTWTAGLQLASTFTSISGRLPWTFIRPPAKTLRGTWRANQRDMLTNTPCRTVCLLANTLQCTWWTRIARHGSYAWKERSFRRRPRQCPRELAMSFAR